MDSKEFEKMDALLRVLYRDGDQAWYHVYTKAGVPKSEADWLYKTLKADGYVKTLHKGADFSIPDPHGVGMTDAGRSWFSKTNYVNEYVLEPKEREMVQTIIVKDSNVTGFNVVSGAENRVNDRNVAASFWTSGWTITIGGGLILLIIGYLIDHFFDVI